MLRLDVDRLRLWVAEPIGITSRNRVSEAVITVPALAACAARNSVAPMRARRDVKPESSREVFIPFSACRPAMRYPRQPRPGRSRFGVLFLPLATRASADLRDAGISPLRFSAMRIEAVLLGLVRTCRLRDRAPPIALFTQS